MMMNTWRWWWWNYFDLLYLFIYFDEDEFMIFYTNKYHKWFVGKCNGLLCLADVQNTHYYFPYFWNPATKTRSRSISITLSSNFKFSFGYDNLSKTHKVLAFNVERNAPSVVKVLSLRNKSWRNIQCFPFFHFIGLMRIRTMAFTWVVLLSGWLFTITSIIIMNLIMLVRLLFCNMWLFHLISPLSHTLSCCYLVVLMFWWGTTC